MMPKNKAPEERQGNDRYITHPDFARWFVKILPRFMQVNQVIDLGSGNGVLATAVSELHPGCFTLGVDLTPPEPGAYRLTEFWQDDVTNPNPDKPWHKEPVDVVVTNPPFDNIVPFFKMGVSLLRPGGIFAALVRVHALETRKRWKTFWSDYYNLGLAHVSFGVDRPSFYPYETSDGAPYVFLAFKGGHIGPTTFSMNSFLEKTAVGNDQYFWKSGFGL